MMIFLTQSTDQNDPNWIFQSCSMKNSNVMQFLNQCNASYYGYDNCIYVQYYVKTKPRKCKKRRYRKMPQKFVLNHAQFPPSIVAQKIVHYQQNKQHIHTNYTTLKEQLIAIDD